MPLGGAEAVGRVAAPPSTLKQSDFYGDWETVVTAVAALAANAVVDAARGVGGGKADARASAVVAACAALAALLALTRSEIVQAAFVKAGARKPLAAAVGGGAVAAALALFAPAWLLPQAPLTALATAATRALYAATEIVVTPSAGLGAGLLALPAGLATALLPPAAARVARAADLALHPPAWGDAWLRAPPLDAAVTRLALAAPAVAMLAWSPLVARVWTDDVASFSAATLITAGAAAIAASRTIVAGGAGGSLVIWYTRKHDWTRGGVGAAGTPAASAAAAAREGELVRLSTGLINVFVVKRAVEAGGFGLLLASLGVLSAAARAVGHPTAAATAAWLGGWCVTVWGLALAWSLLLFRIGYLNDVPGRQVG